MSVGSNIFKYVQFGDIVGVSCDVVSANTNKVDVACASLFIPRSKLCQNNDNDGHSPTTTMPHARAIRIESSLGKKGNTFSSIDGIKSRYDTCNTYTH